MTFEDQRQPCSSFYTLKHSWKWKAAASVGAETQQFRGYCKKIKTYMSFRMRWEARGTRLQGQLWPSLSLWSKGFCWLPVLGRNSWWRVVIHGAPHFLSCLDCTTGYILFLWLNWAGTVQYSEITVTICSKGWSGSFLSFPYVASKYPRQDAEDSGSDFLCFHVPQWLHHLGKWKLHLGCQSPNSSFVFSFYWGVCVCVCINEYQWGRILLLCQLCVWAADLIIN